MIYGKIINELLENPDKYYNEVIWYIDALQIGKKNIV